MLIQKGFLDQKTSSTVPFQNIFASHKYAIYFFTSVSNEVKYWIKVKVSRFRLFLKALKSTSLWGAWSNVEFCFLETQLQAKWHLFFIFIHFNYKILSAEKLLSQPFRCSISNKSMEQITSDKLSTIGIFFQSTKKLQTHF